MAHVRHAHSRERSNTIMREDRKRRNASAAMQDAQLDHVIAQRNARQHTASAIVPTNPDAPAWRNPEYARDNGVHLMPTPKRAYVDAVRTFSKPRTRVVGVAGSFAHVDALTLAGTTPQLNAVRVTNLNDPTYSEIRTVSSYRAPKTTRTSATPQITTAHAHTRAVALHTSEAARLAPTDTGTADGTV